MVPAANTAVEFQPWRWEIRLWPGVKQGDGTENPKFSWNPGNHSLCETRTNR